MISSSSTMTCSMNSFFSTLDNLITVASFSICCRPFNLLFVKCNKISSKPSKVIFCDGNDHIACIGLNSSKTTRKKTSPPGKKWSKQSYCIKAGFWVADLASFFSSIVCLSNHSNEPQILIDLEWKPIAHFFCYLSAHIISLISDHFTTEK